MDNLCHTLAGAALGEAVLKGRTRLGTTTLMIAANLPDIDVAAFATDVPWVAVRRGWTHGILAQAALPVLLAGVMYAICRLRPRLTARDDARFAPLLLLSYIGVLSHVGLDLLNNYGVRLLMPFSSRWFYGDAVFIVDPWLWLMLGVTIWLALTRDGLRPARVMLLVAGGYIGLLIVSAWLAREMVYEDWRARHRTGPTALMVGPMPFTPLQRMVILDDGGEHYATGTFSWLSRSVTYDEMVPKNLSHPSVRRAIAREPRIRSVLSWARFPFFVVETAPSGDVVILRDLRFRERVGEMRTTVPRP